MPPWICQFRHSSLKKMRVFYYWLKLHICSLLAIILGYNEYFLLFAYNYEVKMTKVHGKKSAVPKLSKDKINFFLLVSVAVSSSISMPYIFDSFTTPKILFLYLSATFVFLKITADTLRHKLSLISFPIWASLLICLICLSMIFSVVKSEAPFLRSMFGQFGRGNGIFYYFICFLILILLVVTHNSNSKENFRRVIFTTSWILSIYACLQQIGIDVAKLDNIGPSPVVLTLGNTNFSGGLLSVLFTFVLADLFQNKVLRIKDFFLPLLLLIGVFFTNAVQGYLICFTSILILSSMRIYNLSRFKSLKKLFQIGGIFLVIATILGAVGFGPLSRIFERSTFQMRIQYWKVGARIMRDNFWFGTGADRLYDITPHYMSPGSLELITSTRMDNVHNWFLNFGANFGFIALGAFIALICLTLVKALREKKNLPLLQNSQFPIILSLIVIIIDGMVSIEQPGLGIWMYAFLGLLIGHLVINSNKEIKSERFFKVKSRVSINPVLISAGLIFCLIGTSLVSTRVINDGLLRHAIQKSVIDPSNTNLLANIQDLTKRLKSEPEYIIKSLKPLAAAGNGDALLNLSKAVYEYNPQSIQAIGIRAQVLSVVSSIGSSCPLQSQLIQNSPWIDDTIQKYLICISTGFADKDEKQNLNSILKYFNFTYRNNLVDVGTYENTLAIAIKSRIMHELGNSEIADVSRSEISDSLIELKRTVSDSKYKILEVLLDW